MNNSASEPLLRAPSIDKQAIHNYIDSYQLYIQHCTHAVNQLAYHLFLHIACTTLCQVILYFSGQALSMDSVVVDYIGYTLWSYMLLHYRSSYPKLDPHAIYNKQAQKLLITQIDRNTFQLSLCLLLFVCFTTVHLFLTNTKLMLLADFVLISLTSRAVFQTLLKEKQMNSRLQEMQNRQLYFIQPFTAQDMKEPFEIEQIQNTSFIRNSSLNHLVPQFMHMFYKPKKQARLQSEVEHFDETQIYSH